MSGENLVDHNSISADFGEEKAGTLLTVQGGEFCCVDDGAAAAEVTPRTVAYTPQVSSRPPDHDDHPTPVLSPGASPRSSRKGKKGLAKRVTMGFRRFFDVDSSSLGMAKEQHSSAEGDRSTPRSAGRTITGRKDYSRANEDCFFANDDVFALDTLPPSPSSQPLPVEGGGAAGGMAGAAEGDKGVPIARVSAIVGKVGLYGAFDGHGGSSCANFVSQNLPQAVKSSPAWARLAVRDHDITTSDHTREGSEGIAEARPEDRPVGPGGGGARGGGGGGSLDDLLVGVMKEAILDGFRSTQEAFAREARHGKDSGSTAIVAIVCGRHVVIANLGDSGGLFHNDQDTLGGESLTAKTQFHTVSNEGEKKRVEAAGGTFTNGRLLGKLQPTRSFGDQDIYSRLKEGVLIAVPELTVHQVRPTANGLAFLVLGSDGLWEGVRDSKVIDIVRAEEGKPRSRKKPGKVPLRVAEALVNKAARVSTDDITAVVVLFPQTLTQSV